MKVTRIFDLLERYKTEFTDKPDVLVSKVNGQWKPISSKQYIEDSYNFCYGLMEMGYKRGDKIATITNNCPEWNIVDLGMSMLGVVHVPIFNTLSEDEYKYILSNSEVKSIFVSNKSMYTRIVSAFKDIGDINNIYSFKDMEGVTFWRTVVELGKKNSDKHKEELEKVKSGITEEDFVTLIYTSGTTGVSKGVMLSHKNLVQNFLAAAKIFKMGCDDKYLSILPLCHVGGRMGNYQTQYSGSSLYYAESLGSIAKNMKEIRPSGFDAVPRVLEKIFDTIVSKGNNLEGMKKKIFFWAVDLALEYDINKSAFYKMKLKIADKLIFSKWREAIGGNIRLVGCGGASLPARIERVFWACGIKILNMYGLTETSPVITINRTELPDVKLGSVGCLIDGVEMKIAEDGEILCKGHNVMLGYYKDPELTAMAFDKDGWFKTGDIGNIVDDKFLCVTDRKKEMFKLSNGKYIAPQNVEEKLKESLFIDQAMVVGEHKKQASALISPDFASLKKWCLDNKVDFNDKNELVKTPELIKLIYAEIAEKNKKLNSFERVTKFKLISSEWTPETDELSPTLKLKRKSIAEKYKLELEELLA